MQDRRQLSFVLAVVGAVFGLGSALMTLAVSSVFFGTLPFMGVPEASVFLALFGWLAVASGVGGVLMLVGGLRMRNAAGPALRSAGVLTLVGGSVAVLGGNLLAAALGIVAGVLVLSEPAPPAAPPPYPPLP